jgi:hypothetical protein
MEMLPNDARIVASGRDFPWSPIAEAFQSVVGTFAIVIATSLCGWAVGDMLAIAWLGPGISHRSDLAELPELAFFTPEVFFAVLVSFLRLHQCLCFPSPSEVLKAAAVPFLVWCVATFSVVVRLGAGPPPAPYELIGEWVSEDARFHGELLAQGRAMYLADDGSVTMFCPTPLVARAGQATFDSESSQLAFAFRGAASPPEKMKMSVFFDRAARRVLIAPIDGDEGPYMKRQRKIPNWAKDAVR